MSLDLCVGMFATMAELFDEDPGELRIYRQVFADINMLLRADFLVDALGAFFAREGKLRVLPAAEQPIWLRNGYAAEALAWWVLYHGSVASIRTGLALGFI